MKIIKAIIPSVKINMGGNIIDQPLPINNIAYFDPFLLIHHWESRLPGNQKKLEVGVGPHPHRGFSPVTFIYKGEVNHNDSLGNNHTISSGGTQWMSAGKGITHSERPSEKMAKNGGELEFIQFWINTLAKNKMDQPFYLPLSKEKTPTIKNEHYTIQVVCGNYAGKKGAIKHSSPLNLLRIEMNESAHLSFELKASDNTLIYLLDGELNINNKSCNAKNMVLFENTGFEINVKAKKNTRFIVLSGAPLNEPVVSYGPFVMNTKSEIITALNDSQEGKLGELIE